MEEFFIPTLHTFAMKNPFTGSKGDFRFKITPSVTMNGKEVDFENSSITAVYWHGPFCIEKSTVEAEQTFPMSPQGREDMIAWLRAAI